MGPYIDGLKVGDTLELKGPIPKYPYQVMDRGGNEPHGDYDLKNDVPEPESCYLSLPYQPNIKKKIGMVAGGTGIAPMLQVWNADPYISCIYTSLSVLR